VELVLYAAAAGERVAIRLSTPDPEVVVIASVMPRLSPRLKSTYLSLLGGSPVLVSHLPTCAGGEAIQREAAGMVGRSFEHCVCSTTWPSFSTRSSCLLTGPLRSRSPTTRSSSSPFTADATTATN
jgi:hypothetical protein